MDLTLGVTWIQIQLFYVKCIKNNDFLYFMSRGDTEGYFSRTVKKYCIYPFANSFMHSLGGQLGGADPWICL